jgi:hypothetical protein
MLERAMGDEFGVAPDLDVAARIVWVHDEHADLSVGEQVPTLLALERRVAASAFAVGVRPHEARLGLAAGAIVVNTRRSVWSEDPGVDQAGNVSGL